MLGLVRKAWSGLRARSHVTNSRHPPADDGRGEISDRIRARYDTARREAKKPARQWLRENGVMQDWSDARKAADRW